MGNINLSPIVKMIIIINVIVFILCRINPDFENLSFELFAVFYPESPFFKPYQIISHMFMHGDIGHIFFNMYGFATFGPAIEYLIGGPNFFKLYFIAGLGALVLQFGINYYEIHYAMSIPLEQAINVPMVGASGAIFGILAAFGMLYPNNELQIMFIPISFKAKYFVFIYAMIELGLGLSNTLPGIAHYAHVGGALFGFLYIKYLLKNGGYTNRWN
jgi:membrane associated rhomboid family serine protease